MSAPAGAGNAEALENARRTAADLVSLVSTLAEGGAGTFVVLGLYDMARIPAPPFRNPLVTDLCAAFNQALLAGLSGIGAATTLYFDFESWMASVQPSFQVTDAVYLTCGDAQSEGRSPTLPSRSSDPTAYLFFDTWAHLTARANRLLGDAVTRAVLDRRGQT